MKKVYNLGAWCLCWDSKFNCIDSWSLYSYLTLQVKQSFPDVYPPFSPRGSVQATNLKDQMHLNLVEIKNLLSRIYDWLCMPLR